MPHKIEVFVGGCPLCNDLLTDIEVGKCLKCELKVHDLMDKDTGPLVERFNIRVVPTVLIDEKIKIEGKPDIPFVCSDETYDYFEKHYSLSKD